MKEHLQWLMDEFDADEVVVFVIPKKHSLPLEGVARIYEMKSGDEPMPIGVVQRVGFYCGLDEPTKICIQKAGDTDFADVKLDVDIAGD